MRTLLAFNYLRTAKRKYHVETILTVYRAAVVGTYVLMWGKAAQLAVVGMVIVAFLIKVVPKYRAVLTMTCNVLQYAFATMAMGAHVV